MVSPDYPHLAKKAIDMSRSYLSSSTEQVLKDTEPQSVAELGPIDFEEELSSKQDRYLAGNFVDGTWVGALESDVEGEQGYYNIGLDAYQRTQFALIMPTKDYHPQSAPLRPGYLLHAYRLLVELESQLNVAGETKWQFVVIYDCGEKSGAKLGHKCLRFYALKGEGVIGKPSLPYTTNKLPRDSSSLLKAFEDLLSPEGAIPQQPSYNVIMTGSEVYVVKREDDGFLNKSEGRWDGARLIDIPLS